MSKDEKPTPPNDPDPFRAKASASSDPDAERRRSPRWDISGLQGRVEIESNARVMNLSIDGLAIETSMSIRVGDEYVIHVDTDKDVVPLRATAVWCNLVGTDPAGNGDIEPVYHAGLQIGVDLSSPAKDVLQFIEENSPIEVKQRLYGRFEVSGGREVSLQKQQTCEIRTLNQHGLLMESYARLEPGDRLRIELDLLEELPFRALGRVVFVSPNSDQELQASRRVGLEFESMEELDRLALASFLEHLGD